MLNVKSKNIVLACMLLGCAVSMPPKLDAGRPVRAEYRPQSSEQTPTVMPDLTERPQTKSAVRREFGEWSRILLKHYYPLVQEDRTRTILVAFQLAVEHRLKTQSEQANDLGTFRGWDTFLIWVEKATKDLFTKIPGWHPIWFGMIMRGIEGAPGRVMHAIQHKILQLALNAQCPPQELFRLLAEIRLTDGMIEKQVTKGVCDPSIREKVLEFAASRVSTSSTDPAPQVNEGSFTPPPALLSRSFGAAASSQPSRLESASGPEKVVSDFEQLLQSGNPMAIKACIEGRNHLLHNEHVYARGQAPSGDPQLFRLKDPVAIKNCLQLFQTLCSEGDGEAREIAKQEFMRTLDAERFADQDFGAKTAIFRSMVELLEQRDYQTADFVVAAFYYLLESHHLGAKQLLAEPQQHKPECPIS